MTEQEWRECEDANVMLEFLRGKASDRKLRLFTVACCRLFGDCINLDATRTAIETSERYADKQASEKELSTARSAAHNAAWGAHYYHHHEPHSSENLRSSEQRRYYSKRLGKPSEEVWSRLYFVAFMANTTERLHADEMPMLRTDPHLAQASPSLFRDIFGNLFRHHSIAPLWLAWNEGTVPRLARDIYEERSFADLPILADALEDAGCDDDAILAHLRGPGPHVRGCWALDLILGKQ